LLIATMGDQKLVSPHPRHQIAIAGDGRQPSGGRFQYGVSHRVAIAGVDRFDAIAVNCQDAIAKSRLRK
jgi:hypothetical protein